MNNNSLLAINFDIINFADSIQILISGISNGVSVKIDSYLCSGCINMTAFGNINISSKFIRTGCFRKLAMISIDIILCDQAVSKQGICIYRCRYRFDSVGSVALFSGG